jgi:hypothetical protein
MHTLLRKSLVVTALALGATQLAHAEQSDVVRWQSVIGIIQGLNVVGSGTGAATGVPGPWSAQGGHVTVDAWQDQFRRSRPGVHLRQYDRQHRHGRAGQGNARLRHQRQRIRRQFDSRRYALW